MRTGPTIDFPCHHCEGYFDFDIVGSPRHLRTSHSVMDSKLPCSIIVVTKSSGQFYQLYKGQGHLVLFQSSQLTLRLRFQHRLSSNSLSSLEPSIQIPSTQASQLQSQHFPGVEPDLVYHGSQSILPTRYTKPHPSALVQPNTLTNFSDHGCEISDVY